MINKYKSQLDKKFRKNQKVPLSAVIQESKRGSTLSKETLVVMPFVNGEVRLKILDKATPDKGFSTPLILNTRGKRKGLTPQYLRWFLKHDFVVEYLLPNVKGSVFPRIPKKLLFELEIPVPVQKKKIEDESDTTFIKTSNPFRRMIKKYYDDYLFNFEKGRFATAVILAGAIAEIILYQLLLDNEIENKILANDNTLGLAKLITYVQLLKLDKELEIPLTHFHELRKKRNAAIHVGLILKNNESFSKDDLNCFNQIIKHFGI